MLLTTYLGKTYFLWYLLRYRLSKRLPAMFSLHPNKVFFFCKDGAFQLTPGGDPQTLALEAAEMSAPEAVWSLVDVGTLRQEPPAYLVKNIVFVVQTTSPDEIRYKGWSEVRFNSTK